MSVLTDIVAYVQQWDLSGDLTTFVSALGSMFEEVEQYASDDDVNVGWATLWDYELATDNGLPWLCMVAGEIVPPAATSDQLRALVAANPNAHRGTPLSIANAVKQELTGAKVIGIRERFRSDGTADNDALAVFTYLSQTPNQPAVLAALRRTVPADINIYYQCLTGATWAGLEAGEGSGSWTHLEGDLGPTWTNIEGATPGYTIFL